MFDTSPVALDDHGHKQRRRMSDQKIQEWANSALLRLISYVITGVGMPLGFIVLMALLGRLSSIESAINNGNVFRAQVELRLQMSEATLSKVAAMEARLTTQVEENIKQNYEIQLLRSNLADAQKKR